MRATNGGGLGSGRPSGRRTSRFRGAAAGRGGAWAVGWALLGSLFLGSLLGTPASADVGRADLGAYRCVDAAKVYLGNSKLFQRPAVIAADRVYREIAEYREILEKGLTDKDVQYHFLMKKASERFTKAVKAMAKREGHDLVAEAGAVQTAKADSPAPPDRTQAVIGEIS